MSMLRCGLWSGFSLTCQWVDLLHYSLEAWINVEHCTLSPMGDVLEGERGLAEKGTI